MKKAVYILCVLIAGILVSCKDYLDVDAGSTLDASSIYSNYDLAADAVSGIYVSFGETNSYRGRFLPWYGMNTDCEWYNSSESGDDKSDLCTYSTSPSNSQMNTSNNAWAKMYEGIERANLCIEGLKEYGDIENDEDMAYLYGEAVTLRAVFYSDLLKTWGDVPYHFVPLTTEDLYVAKTSRNTIYKKLIDDLGEIEDYVPWPTASDHTGTSENINKAFVKGLKARLILAAVGYSQYDDGSSAGIIEKGTDYSSILNEDSLKQLALDECTAVIAQEGGYVKLKSSFEDVFVSMCQDDLTAGSESLWEIPFADGRGRMVYTFGIKHSSSDQFTSQASGGYGGPTPFMYYDYDEADLRRDVSVVPYSWTDDDNDGYSIQTLGNSAKWYFGKFRYEWMSRKVTSSSDDGVNKIYMRYAEVLLMAAELENDLANLNAAKTYLRKIRERAFDEADWPEKVDDYLNNITSQEEMFDAVVDENKFEFCGEMIRKQSLIRWNLLGEKLEEAKEKMSELAGLSGDYTDVPSTLYYNYTDYYYERLGETYSNTALDIYGLNRGETGDMSGSYEYSATWLDVDDPDLDDDKIESIYTNNPDNYQFWPIWTVFIDNSNGMLKNDTWYQ